MMLCKEVIWSETTEGYLIGIFECHRGMGEKQGIGQVEVVGNIWGSLEEQIPGPHVLLSTWPPFKCYILFPQGSLYFQDSSNHLCAWVFNSTSPWYLLHYWGPVNMLPTWHFLLNVMLSLQILHSIFKFNFKCPFKLKIGSYFWYFFSISVILYSLGLQTLKSFLSVWSQPTTQY